jgi:uncharacterized protein YbaA (DUF1428 family)
MVTSALAYPGLSFLSEVSGRQWVFLKRRTVMSYVDGYILPVPKKHVKTYRRMAEMGRDAWMKNGAIDYKECVGDDLVAKWGTAFTRMMKLKPGETVVFAYIVFKSRAHRDSVNKKVMKEMNAMAGSKDMPFDAKRMVYGGFKTIVE